MLAPRRPMSTLYLGAPKSLQIHILGPRPGMRLGNNRSCGPVWLWERLPCATIPSAVVWKEIETGPSDTEDILAPVLARLMPIERALACARHNILCSC